MLEGKYIIKKRTSKFALLINLLVVINLTTALKVNQLVSYCKFPILFFKR